MEHARGIVFLRIVCEDTVKHARGMLGFGKIEPLGFGTVVRVENLLGGPSVRNLAPNLGSP